MERIRHQQKSFSDSLKATLNCYRLSSADSLGGPSGYSALAAQMWYKENKQSPPLPPPPPLIHIPLLMPKDTSSRRSETVLGGEKISCFIVGGEKRLCLPQILTTVLKDFSISEINRACAELHIYCSRCSLDQLEILKVLGVLPFNTTQCGLISKSDAERLLSFLGVEYHVERNRDFNPARSKGIPIYHECFGRGEGTFHPDLYTTPDSACISCGGCRMNFAPSKFVSHSHRGSEKRTCHWGFDRDNWRYYILVPDYIETSRYKELEKELKKIKEKFSQSCSLSKSDNHHRRSPHTVKRSIKTESEVEYGKRLKEEEQEFPLPAATNTYPGFPFVSRPSAFKPWSSGLPSLVPSLSNMPIPQDDALLKAFGPLMSSGSLLPRYFPFPPPGIIPPLISSKPAILPSPRTSSNPNIASSLPPSDWLNSVKSQKVPNITLDPAEQQKRAEDFAIMKHRLREDAMRRKLDPSSKFDSAFNFCNQQRNVLPVKNEIAEVPCLKPNHHDVINDVSMSRTHHNHVDEQRENDEPLELTKSSAKNRSSLPSAPEEVQSSNEDEIIDVTGGVDPSEKKITSNKPSSDKAQSPRKSPIYVPKSVCSPHPTSASDISCSYSHSTNSKYTHRDLYSVSGHSQTPMHSSSYPIVSPMDNSQYRWSFPSASYIISASGTKELKRLQSIFGENCGKKKVCEVLHEMTRIKWSSEETLAMKNKTLNDIKSELNRMRASKDKDIEEARMENRQLRVEIERMRTDFHSRISDATDSLVELGTKLSHSKHLEEVEQDAMQHKILERLHEQVNKKEDVIQTLEKKLMEERERRVAVERKIDDVINGSHGKILSFMTGSLHSVGPHLKPHIHSSSDRKHLVPSADKSPILTQMEDPPSEDEAIDVGTPSGRPLCTSPSHSSSKDSGVHDV